MGKQSEKVQLVEAWLQALVLEPMESRSKGRAPEESKKREEKEEGVLRGDSALSEQYEWTEKEEQKYMARLSVAECAAGAEVGATNRAPIVQASVN